MVKVFVKEIERTNGDGAQNENLSLRVSGKVKGGRVRKVGPVPQLLRQGPNKGLESRSTQNKPLAGSHIEQGVTY